MRHSAPGQVQLVGQEALAESKNKATSFLFSHQTQLRSLLPQGPVSLGSVSFVTLRIDWVQSASMLFPVPPCLSHFHLHSLLHRIYLCSCLFSLLDWRTSEARYLSFLHSLTKHLLKAGHRAYRDDPIQGSLPLGTPSRGVVGHGKTKKYSNAR